MRHSCACCTYLRSNSVQYSTSDPPPRTNAPACLRRVRVFGRMSPTRGLEPNVQRRGFRGRSPALVKALLLSQVLSTPKPCTVNPWKSSSPKIDSRKTRLGSSILWEWAPTTRMCITPAFLGTVSISFSLSQRCCYSKGTSSTGLKLRTSSPSIV